MSCSVHVGWVSMFLFLRDAFSYATDYQQCTIFLHTLRLDDSIGGNRGREKEKEREREREREREKNKLRTL